MSLTAAEQYMLELINRARLDPLGEAARFGIDLNQGLPAGTLHTGTRFVLAPNADLDDAATGHSLWMLANDLFTHVRPNGSDPESRMIAEGYDPWVSGENISWSGSTGAVNLNSIIAMQHRSLFLSAGHRTNILYDAFREIGIAQEAGIFTSGSTNWNASMVTQNFGSTGSALFVTGVAYDDSDASKFYSVGEGVAGVSFAAGASTATTAAAGGYALTITTPAPAVSVSGSVGGQGFSVLLDVSLGNAKLDVVNATTFHSSADITLVSGLRHVRLLGVGDLDATGNSAANRIEGNAGANDLRGGGGADTLLGGTGDDAMAGEVGNDRLSGQNGQDTLQGGGGSDVLDGGDDNDLLQGDAGHDRLMGGQGDDGLSGGEGNDTLQGGGGVDRLAGGSGDDILTGGSRADVFVFGRAGGNDRVTDLQGADRLELDDAIWGGSAKSAAQVVADHGRIVNGVAVLDFGPADKVTLEGITTLVGLDGYLTIV